MAEKSDNPDRPEPAKADAGTTRKSFLLRVDPALWSELEKWAASDLRSINGQVEWILRQAVEKRKGKS